MFNVQRGQSKESTFYTSAENVEKGQRKAQAKRTVGQDWWRCVELGSVKIEILETPTYY